MPEVYADLEAPWSSGASVYGGVLEAPWGDGVSIYGPAAAFTPGTPPPGGSTTLFPYAPRFKIGKRSSYIQHHVLSAVDLRDAAALDITTISISTDEDAIYWTLQAQGTDTVFTKLLSGTQPARVGITLDGVEWHFVVESVSRQRSHVASPCSVTARSVTVAAAAPYVVEQNWVNEGPSTAAQMAALSNSLTGLTVQWGLEDWLLPDAVFSFSGTPMGVVRRLAEAVGGLVRSHRTEFQVEALCRYPVLPNEWPLLPPDVQIAFEAVQTDTYQRDDAPDYNGVYVSGQQQGVVAHVYRQGTNGAKLHPLVTDVLLTDEPAVRQRGRSILGASGPQASVTLGLPFLAGEGEPGAMEVGWIVKVLDPAGVWFGVVRSVRVEADLVAARQTIVVQRHFEPERPPEGVATIFFGENTTVVDSVEGEPTIMRDLWLAEVGLVGVMNFETSATGPAVGAHPFVGLTGVEGTIVDLEEDIPPAIFDFYSVGRFNTTPDGSKFLQAYGSVRVDFSTPVKAFGFFGTDLGDYKAQLNVLLTKTTGEVVPHVVPHDSSTVGSGYSIFWGIVDRTGAQYVSATLQMVQWFGITIEEHDVFGFDDLVIGTPT